MLEDVRTTDGAESKFDADAIRDRYKQERNRRVRADTDDQYVETSGKFAVYEDFDPYAPKVQPREPRTSEVDVVVVGAGWSGLLSAARLREAGEDDFLIVEAGADFGGTWYWNRYPGAQCDIDSTVYLPLLEETGYVPKEKYSYSSEIFEQAQRIGRHYNLYEKALLQTRVTEMRWDDEKSRWIVHTNRGDAIQARFIIVGPGLAPRPKLPGIPGLANFKGHTFHTCRWDFAYTGGDSRGGLDGLAGKKVGIIGTGATAIQCVPYVAQSAEHLYVFQRTPSSVDFRGNKPTDPEWKKALKPGWQRERVQNFGMVASGQPVEADLINDGWTEILGKLTSWFPLGEPPAGETRESVAYKSEMADFKKMSQIRARVDAEVKDPAIAELLKPWYRQFCKRPTFNDEYLPTFNRPNVTLVDTAATQGVQRATERGLVANDIEYDLDCIIFATGFEISTPWRRRFGYGIFGRGGHSLFDKWDKGLRTLHGYSTHGFPNWFFVGASQNGISPNYAEASGEQARHIAYIISEAKKRGATSVEVTSEAEEAWLAEIRRLGGVNREFVEACTPGYYNNEGNLDSPNIYGADAFALGCPGFNKILEDWRSEGSLSGLELK